MSMFTLAISYLTMLNLPWFMDLILQFLFFTASDFAFITKHTHNWTSFPLWLAASSFLELFVLFLGSYPVVYWTPSNLGGLSFGVISFCLFIQFIGFSWKAYCFAIPSSCGSHLSELSTMTHPSWEALYSMAHCFIVLPKPLHHY